ARDDDAGRVGLVAPREAKEVEHIEADVPLRLNIVVQQEEVVRLGEDRREPGPHVLDRLHVVTVGSEDGSEPLPGVTLSLDYQNAQRHRVLSDYRWSNERARTAPRGSAGRQVPETVGRARFEQGSPPAAREKTTSYDLLGRAGDVVGQRARFAGEVRGALIVALIEG